jgi:hypothetical protein
MVVRHDMDLEKMGVVAELLDDMSPFQVGTRGEFDGSGFTLAGRIKLVYDQGMWSEWYALFDDGREGWLAEAQGFYMMSFPVEGITLPPSKEIAVGTTLDLDGTRYVADDIRVVNYAGTEGELPFVFTPGYKAVSVDFRNKTGGFASILYGPEDPQIYIGRYERFDTFKFDYLKEIDGWTRA